MFKRKRLVKTKRKATERKPMSDYKVVAKITQKQIVDNLQKNTRIDGRGLLEYREITTDLGIIEKASGSALVSLGKTKILAGVKVELGEPYPDKPEDGVLTVNAELIPLASPDFEPGPPSEDAIELARVVDRGLRESKAIDTKKLCIVPGKKVFVVFVDLNVLDHSGNLFDTAALASVLALMNAKTRDYTVSKSGVLKYKDSTSHLPLQNFPVEVTVAKIGEKMIVDATLEEEAVIDAQITIAVGKDNEICAVQKSLFDTLSQEEVHQTLQIATEKAEEMRAKVLRGVGGWLDGNE
jgi:exosome complex component RRP42